MKKTLITAAFSIMLAGAAFAQTSARDGGSSNSGLMGPFFTDETMTEVRPMEENKGIYEGMDGAAQDTLKSQCESIAAQGSSTMGDTTASIDPDQLPPAMASLCDQVTGW